MGNHWRTARQMSGAQPSAGPHSALTTLRDLSSPPLPSRSILKPLKVSEPPVHKFQALDRALFFFVTAAALVGSVFLLFVRL